MSKPELVSFPTPAAFRAWLKAHHATATELLLRCFKVHAADQGVTYAQALDEALCYGWIDGIRRAADSDSFSVRFTPRKPTSIWSRVNIAHVERLTAGRAHEEAGARGVCAQAGREDGGRTRSNARWRCRRLRQGSSGRTRPAWAFYQSQPPWYRRRPAPG